MKIKHIINIEKYNQDKSKGLLFPLKLLRKKILVLSIPMYKLLSHVKQILLVESSLKVWNILKSLVAILSQPKKDYYTSRWRPHWALKSSHWISTCLQVSFLPACLSFVGSSSSFFFKCLWLWYFVYRF